MTKQNLKLELEQGITLEFTDGVNLFELQKSKLRGKFLLRTNGDLNFSTDSFTRLWMRLDFQNLELLDLFK
jgi:hypothetical protein|tara:strand:+ start:273 stop:485 length:213 start_codon:yes stop_codon:yes gene_type:complete